MDCLQSKIYSQIIKKTFGNKTKVNELEIKEIDRKWDDLKEKSVKDYKKEPEYDKITSMAKKENLSYRQLYNKGKTGRIDDIEYVNE
jgi:DNA integrity scanning protein DisA with diadenylate cyclase activity